MFPGREPRFVRIIPPAPLHHPVWESPPAAGTELILSNVGPSHVEMDECLRSFICSLADGKRRIPPWVYDFKRREIKQMQRKPGRSNMKVFCCSQSLQHLLRLLRFLVDDETRTLALTFPLLGEDNIAVTDGLWVIWALLRVSVHCELIVD